MPPAWDDRCEQAGLADRSRFGTSTPDRRADARGRGRRVPQYRRQVLSYLTHWKGSPTHTEAFVPFRRVPSHTPRGGRRRHR